VALFLIIAGTCQQTLGQRTETEETTNKVKEGTLATFWKNKWEVSPTCTNLQYQNRNEMHQNSCAVKFILETHKIYISCWLKAVILNSP
jgi:hypothetical protein